MAREHPSGVSDSGGARSTVAFLAALLLAASVLAPASTTAAVVGDRAAVVAAAGNADGTTGGNDGTTTLAGNDGPTTVAGNDESPTVGNDETVTIRGRVADDDGDAVAGDAMELGSADRNLTDQRGRYRLEGTANRSYELRFRQPDGGGRDGVPAVYAVEQVNVSTNLTRDVALPSAHVLNVTVVAENETRVENATVHVIHANGSANASLSGTTDGRGRLAVGGRVGVELAGDVTVAVEAPNASLLNESISLSVTNATDETVVLPLNDSDPPTVEHERGNRTVNVSEEVTFDASASTDESGVARTTWSFLSEGPNGTMVLQDEIHGERFSQFFTEPATYEVTVTVTDYAGNANNSTFTVTVQDVRPPDAALAVDAENATVEVDESVGFNASDSWDDVAVHEYRWDFDGDGAVDRNTSDPTVNHTYAVRGTYNATVVVVDESGNVANATRLLTVEMPPPNANFTVNESTPDIGEDVLFDANPTTASGDVRSYTWEVPSPTGKTFLNGSTLVRDFPDSGTYNVTLNVTDEYNHSDEYTRTITVPNDPPVADVPELVITIAENQTVELDGTASDPNGDSLAYRWNQTGGPRVNLSTNSTTTTTFLAPEVNETTTLLFEFVVTDDHDATDIDAVTVRVADSSSPNVTADPTYPTVGANVTFRANGTGPFRWEIDGDEAPDPDGPTTTYQFDATGRHNVTLTDGVGREVTRTVTVVAPPNASATAPANVTTGETLLLDGTATNASNATYEWTQTAGPDATIANDSAVRTNATAPGVNETTTLLFELIVTDEYGHADADSVAVAVVPRNSSNASDAPTNASGGTNESSTVGNETSGNETTSGTGGTGGNESTGGTGGSGSTGGSTGGTTGGTSGSTGGTSGGNAGGTSGSMGGTVGGTADSTGGVGDSSPGGGGGQSGWAGDATNGTDAGDANARTGSASVNVQEVAGETDRVFASVENAPDGVPAAVDLPAAFGGNDAAFESVAVVPDGAANFSLSVGASADPPDGTPAPDADAVLSYLTVEERDIGDASIASARFRFRVAVAALAAADASPEDVRLYRYHDGSWQTLAANLTGKRGGFYRFEAVSPGFSVFAVGVGTATAPGTADATDETTTTTGTGSGGTTTAQTGDATSRGNGAGDGADSTESGDTTDEERSGSGGFSGTTITLGLFGAALLAAALWGYLLS